MRFSKIFYILLICLAGILFFSSCSFSEVISQEDSYKVYLPEWPPSNSSYPELSRWFIKIQTQNDCKQFYTNERSLEISTDKNSTFAILAYPVTFCNSGSEKQEEQYFKPAGKVFPLKNNSNLNWEEGFLAEIYVDAVKGNFPVQNFNWEKAQNCIQKKYSQNQNFYNPWLCNKSKILENMFKGNFRESYLNLTGCIFVSLEDDAFKNKIPSDCFLISSYIPQNEFIKTQNSISILKDQKELFIFGNHNTNIQNLGIIIEYKSKKNISADVVYLPIFNDVL